MEGWERGGRGVCLSSNPWQGLRLFFVLWGNFLLEETLRLYYLEVLVRLKLFLFRLCVSAFVLLCTFVPNFLATSPHLVVRFPGPAAGRLPEWGPVRSSFVKVVFSYCIL